MRVTARVRRERLDMFGRMFAAQLDGPAPGPANGDGEWAEVTLRFAAVPAARVLLSLGGDVVVTSPPEVRDDLRETAAAVIATYRAGTVPS